MRRRIANCAVCGRPRADHPLVELQSGCRQIPIAGWTRGGFAAAAAVIDAVPMRLQEHDRVDDVIGEAQLELKERDQFGLALDLATALLPVAFHDEARR